MNVAILIGTYGADEWAEAAWSVAYPSTIGQGAAEVIVGHEKDGTLASCRNRLAAEAESDWLCFLDADDELGEGYIEAMSKAEPVATRIEGVGVGYPETLLTPAVQYVRGRQRPAPRIWPKVDLRVGNYLVIGTLVSSLLFLEVGGFKDWPMYEDWDLWQRCVKAGAVVIEVPDAVYVAHARIGSRNRGPTRKEKLAAHEMIQRENHPEMFEPPPPPVVKKPADIGMERFHL